MKILTPLKAIRAKCIDCMCGQMVEVKLCPCKDCSLWPYRFGKRPKTAGIDSEPENPDLSNGFEEDDD